MPTVQLVVELLSVAVKIIRLGAIVQPSWVGVVIPRVVPTVLLSVVETILFKVVATPLSSEAVVMKHVKVAL
jgi:hypothetical protein